MRQDLARLSPVMPLLPVATLLTVTNGNNRASNYAYDIGVAGQP